MSTTRPAAGRKLGRGDRARQRALRSLQNEIRKQDNIASHGRVDAAAAGTLRRHGLPPEQLEHALALADAEFEAQRARAAAEALGIHHGAYRGRR